MTRPKESLLPLESVQLKLKCRRVRLCSTSPEVDDDVWLGTLVSACREINQTCVHSLLCVPFLSSNDHTDLAKDQILCFEIMAKAKSNWSILYPLTVLLKP